MRTHPGISGSKISLPHFMSTLPQVSPRKEKVNYRPSMCQDGSNDPYLQVLMSLYSSFLHCIRISRFDQKNTTKVIICDFRDWAIKVSVTSATCQMPCHVNTQTALWNLHGQQLRPFFFFFWWPARNWGILSIALWVSHLGVRFSKPSQIFQVKPWSDNSCWRRKIFLYPVRFFLLV